MKSSPFEICLFSSNDDDQCVVRAHPDHHRAVFDEEYWVRYRKVNEKFAEETLKALRRMDKVVSYDDNDNDDNDDDGNDEPIVQFF